MIGLGLVLLWVLLEEEDPAPPPPKAEAKKESKEKKEASQDSEEEVGRSIANEKPRFTKEEKEMLDQKYRIIKETFYQRKYREALLGLEELFQVVDDWEQARQIESLAKQGLAKN